MTVNPDLLFVITSNGLGDGEPDLVEAMVAFKIVRTV
jgi:hypothetical protein